MIIPFQKRPTTDYPPIKLIFHNTTTKKIKKIKFYDYFSHGYFWSCLGVPAA